MVTAPKSGATRQESILDASFWQEINYVYVKIFAHIDMHMYTYMCIYIYTCLYSAIYAYINTYIYMIFEL